MFYYTYGDKLLFSLEDIYEYEKADGIPDNLDEL